MKEKKQYNREKIFSSTNGARTTGYPHEKKMNLDMALKPFTKINSKWITDLSIKYKTIKLLDDDIGENLDDFGHDDVILDTHQRHNP